MSLGEPLLSDWQTDAEPEDRGPRTPPIGRRCLFVLTAGSFLLYILLGAVERVSFARMAFSMPDGVLLMHTLLSLMSLLLFTVLQLARSQSTERSDADMAPQHLHLPDVLSIAALDVMHSLLALAGATDVPGVVQTLLLQTTVPAVALFAVLLPAENAAQAASEAAAEAARASGVQSPVVQPRKPPLHQQLLHLVNNNSPSAFVGLVFRAPRTYQVLGAALIAVAVSWVAVTPLEGRSSSSGGVGALIFGEEAVGLGSSAPAWLRTQQRRQQADLEHRLRVRWQMNLSDSGPGEGVRGEGTQPLPPGSWEPTPERPTRSLEPSARAVSDDHPRTSEVGAEMGQLVNSISPQQQQPQLPQQQQQQQQEGQQQQQSSGGSSGGGRHVDGRFLLVASFIISAFASAHKRRCLSQRPVDVLVFNTSLSAVQLFVGLLFAPPLLLALYQRPIKDTLVQLARGLRCFMSGMNPHICGDNHDAFGVRPRARTPSPRPPTHAIHCDGDTQEARS